MSFSLDQGLPLDSLWSSGDLYFENSLEDHGVSWRLVLDKIALEVSGDTAPSQEAFFLTLQLLDMSHRRWSPRNASVAVEFGDVHSLAAAAFVTSKLLPERGLDEAPQQQQQHPLPLGPGPPQPVRTLPGLAHSSCSQPRQTLAPQRLDSSHVLDCSGSHRR